MEIKQSKATSLQISDVQGLDLISVYLEDYEPRKGKITIDCYGKAWSSYWGGMGDRTIAQFFVDCDNHYLAKNLSSIDSEIDDYDALAPAIREAIKQQLDDGEISQTTADILTSELNENVCYMNEDDGFAWCKFGGDLLHKVFGDDWYYSIPKKPNPDYRYLCRIIDAVRCGLVEHSK